MQHIGITGGIGSGKSTVCAIFNTLGVPIYYADDRAKWLVANELQQEVSNAFGADVFNKNGLDKVKLAERAFSSQHNTEKLNKIVHPAVGKDYIIWQQQQNAIYTLKEAALLIEAGSYKILDQLIVVTAPEELRIDRVIKRGGIGLADIKTRISKQLTDKERLIYADFTIVNDGSISLIKQVLNIHHQLIKNAEV